MSNQMWRVRYDIRCKTRDSHGNFTGICTVDSTYSTHVAADLLIENSSTFNMHCYDYWVDTVLEPV